MSESQVAANEAEDQDIKIEVEDDTPAEDRGRTPLPQNMVEELEKDDLEEYSDKVKKRLSQMKKVWHDERREKERATREREEALRFAQAQAEENKLLKNRLAINHNAYVNQVTNSAKVELEATRKRVREAYESGDSEAIAKAQEALTDIKLKTKEIEKLRPPARQEPENDVKQAPQAKQEPPKPHVTDPKAAAWAQKNTWFGADEEMTALALGLHEKLVRSGVDPKSDEYYRQVDTTMRKRFPEQFEDEDTQTTEQEKPAPRTKAANVVAPATRSTAPKQIRLTATQVALAKRLGLSNEAYARELMKLENN